MKLFAKGNTAEVYDYKEGVVCKLFWDGYPVTSIQRECENAKVMGEAGLPVPCCYGVIEEGSRSGILYEKLEGDTLLADFLKTGDAASMVQCLTTLHQQILSCHTKRVLDYKEFLRYCASSRRVNANGLLEKIDHLPDGDVLCHGDFHPNNVMKGMNGQAQIIDFMNVCHGPGLYDIARTYCLIANGDVPGELAGRDAIISAQNQFADAYLAAMRVEKEELKEFIEVIKECRKAEVNI